MDYGRLNRKELQAMCKQHGIPANKTNVFMAEALGALLNAPKVSEQLVEADPNPAVVVKARAKRTARSTEVADVVQACEVDDLSSLLAKSGLSPGSEEIKVVAKPSQLETGRTRRDTPMTKFMTGTFNDELALVEPTLEVLLPIEDTTNSLVSLMDDEAPAPLLGYSRRVPKAKKQQSDVATACSSSGPIGSAPVVAEQDTHTPETATSVPVLEIMMMAGKAVTGEAATLDVSPAETESAPVAQNHMLAETLVPDGEGKMVATKTTKARSKRPTKVKPVSPLVLPILEDGFVLHSGATGATLDSPTLGLATAAIAINDNTRREVLSPALSVEFEFQPVAESFAEIMTHGRPLVEESKRYQTRIGRKPGKSCKSCTPEKKLESLMQEMLGAVEVVDTEQEVEAVREAGKTKMLNTPVKDNNDKENSVNNIDLHSLSIRKLQKEVQRRGLSKRNNTRVKV